MHPARHIDVAENTTPFWLDESHITAHLGETRPHDFCASIGRYDRDSCIKSLGSARRLDRPRLKRGNVVFLALNSEEFLVF